MSAWQAARELVLGERSLRGKPDLFAGSPLRLAYDRIRWGELGIPVWQSQQIIGWTRGAEAVALAQASYGLPEAAIVVELDSFLGCSTILLAGARKLAGSGLVYCVDPFDASGDAFSASIYQSIVQSLSSGLRAEFEANLRWADLSQWVVVLQGVAEAVAATWAQPIDLLFLDGDHSRAAVQAAFDAQIAE